MKNFSSFGFEDTEDIRRNYTTKPTIPPRKEKPQKEDDNPFSGESPQISDQAYAQGRW